jgi:hypothetical protein
MDDRFLYVGVTHEGLTGAPNWGFAIVISYTSTVRTKVEDANNRLTGIQERMLLFWEVINL